MRTNIYYWKCDNDIPIKEKLIYNKKYSVAPIEKLVKEIFYYHFGKKPDRIKPADNMGNHYVYFVSLDNQQYVFRSDDGKLDDDYLEVEEIVMQFAKGAGIPVPEVLITDTTREKFSVNYQISKRVKGQNMAKFFNEGKLQKDKISQQLGMLVAKLHSIKTKGFGFFNTVRLKETGKLIGLDKSNKQYFYKKLVDHIEFLIKVEFLNRKEASEIMNLIEKYDKHLEIKQGVLVHKDITFWNLVGTEDKINAIVDWDDVISGDPVDDIAIMRCFYKDDVFLPFLEGYRQVKSLPSDFHIRLNLYVIRNMIWKAVFRIYMGYMKMDSENKRLNMDKTKTLWQFTRDQLFNAVKDLRNS